MERSELRAILLAGHAIPALPLALRVDGTWSERHERALVRYYADAGAGGVAVGVHSTQFEIRDPGVALFEPVLRCAAETILARRRTHADRPLLAVAGVCGPTVQALREAGFARDTGYDAALLGMAALGDASEEDILRHVRLVAQAMPVIGFYLQPAVGGRIFTYDFWRAFMEIEEVVAVKMAPFNRYFTWDVVRAFLESDRADIALYTGNDDNIVIDLLTTFEWQGKSCRIQGGLLGHWGVWTHAAVRLLGELKAARATGTLDARWLTVNQQVTDMNAALFDAAHGFRGCVPGILEVLRRQGLVPSARTLKPGEGLSPGQAKELDRVCAAYPQWTDDAFVAANLDRWLDGE